MAADHAIHQQERNIRSWSAAPATSRYSPQSAARASELPLLLRWLDYVNN